MIYMKAVKNQNIKVNNFFKIGSLILVHLLILQSCEDPSDRIKNEKLSLRLEKMEFYINSTFDIEIGKADESFDSLYVNGSLWKDFTSNSKKITLSYSQVGTKSINLKAFHNGKEKLGNVNLKILSQKAIKPISYKIVKILPHDPKAYTQGLEMHNGFLYESLGQYRQSELRKQEFPEKDILKSHPIASDIFAEGLTILRDTVYQLTWKARKGFKYDLDLNRIGDFSFPTVEGWGLANDGQNMILSDGSHIIYFLDSKMNIKRGQEIYNGRQPLGQINELEYVDGKLYANIYTTDYIFIINPQNGVSEAYVDLSGLRKNLSNPEAEVLNGIAYIKETGNFLVTGKYWDKAFVIKLI